jgi:alanine racemase
MLTAKAEIDLNALQHNFNVIKQHSPRSKIVAVVKGNAYGHDAAKVATTLFNADAFAVARIEEAVSLRQAGITKPVILLEGCFCASDLQIAAKQQFQPVIHNAGQLADILSSSLAAPIKVWLKIDTGMHRIGIYPEQVAHYVNQLSHSANVAGDVGFVSHFYQADELSSPTTLTQLERFIQATSPYPGDKSLSNSAGVLYWSDAHFDWVRPGIALYGISPRAESNGVDEGLLPVMTLKSKLIAVRQQKTGEIVGYGGHWKAERDTCIGVVAMGYGDGYPRMAPAGTPILVNGRKAHIVGRVSMDMMTVDLGPDSQDQVGDEVTLWGTGLPAEEVARHIGTIAYELVIKMTNRVERQFLSTRHDG